MEVEIDIDVYIDVCSLCRQNARSDGMPMCCFLLFFSRITVVDTPAVSEAERATNKDPLLTNGHGEVGVQEPDENFWSQKATPQRSFFGSKKTNTGECQKAIAKKAQRAPTPRRGSSRCSRSWSL